MFQSGVLDSEATIIDTVKHIMNEGGLKSFWRGNGANVVKIAPESACKFFFYDVFKNLVCEYPDNPKMYERFIAGGLAGGIAQTAIYPLVGMQYALSIIKSTKMMHEFIELNKSQEIAKTRLALASTGEYKGILDCLRSIVSKKGVGALYKGWSASVIGIVPYAGVDLMVYNTIKDLRTKRRKQWFSFFKYKI